MALAGARCQIVKTMAKKYGDAVGPWRAFLPLA
jgi:hypothetical protein